MTSTGPKYPYGLCISFDEDTLEKLGLDDGEMPEVGDMIHLMAMAKVTSVSENERESVGGATKKCCRIELQITHLATENEDTESVREEMAEKRRGRFYDEEEEAE